MATLHRDEAAGQPEPPPYAGPAWLALGFRPFYLLAAAFAVLSILLWMASLYGHGAGRIDLAWHMHEMVFGFVVAVMIGFLYTAARTWTGLWTPRGAQLAALAGLWVAGRLAMLAWPSWWMAVIDVLFIPVAALPLFHVLRRSGNTRNLVMIVLLALLALANLVFHAIVLGVLPGNAAHAVYFAIIVITLIEAIIGGRVIPMFTASTAGAKSTPAPTLERISMILTALAGLAWALAMPVWLAAPLALGAALAQAIRLSLWQPFATLRYPLLWILHLSYAWISAGFVLLALASMGWVPVSAAVHALAVGATSGLIVGMITRTALGHTGRPLQAGRLDTAMYLLIQLGAMARVAASLAPSLYQPLLLAAAVCWCTTFLLYLVVYVPRLCSPRIDGRAG